MRLSRLLPTSKRVPRRPDPTEAIKVLEPVLTTRATITIVGHCEVEYDGRASSYLGFGDRLVILKPDGYPARSH